MDVKIKSKQLLFSEIKQGELFMDDDRDLCYPMVYMRVKPMTNRDGMSVNAVSLTDGEFYDYEKETEVIKVEGELEVSA